MSHIETSSLSRCSTAGWTLGWRRPPSPAGKYTPFLSSLSHLYNMSIKCLLCTRIGASNFPDSLVSNHVRFILLFIDWLKTFGQHEPTELVLVCLLSCCQVDQCKPSWIFYSWAVSSLHNLMCREKYLLNIILLFISSVIKWKIYCYHFLSKYLSLACRGDWQINYYFYPCNVNTKISQNLNVSKWW